MGSIIGAITDPILGTDLQGKKAAGNALSAQQGATDIANARADEALVDQKKEMEPWKAGGLAAFAGMQDGSFMGKDPGYQFRLDQGNRALNAAASARGNARGGATMKALTRYGQDYASNEYNNSFNRANTIANYGNQASTNLGNFIGGNAATVGNNAINMGNANAASQIAGANRVNQDIGQLVQGGTMAAMAFSDARLKTNVQPVNPEEMAEMRKHLKAYHFNYTSEEFGKGDWVGVMAQDLEKSKLGRTLVFQDVEGRKCIDTNKVMCLFLASMAGV